MSNNLLEVDKYMAGAYKIAGFSLMIPFGRLFLSLQNHKLHEISDEYAGYIVISIALFCLGIIIIFEGAKILGKKEK